MEDWKHEYLSGKKHGQGYNKLNQTSFDGGNKFSCDVHNIGVTLTDTTPTTWL